MRIVTAATLVAAFIASAPALSKENAQQPVEQTEAGATKSADTEKKLCRRVDTSGTRMGGKMCLTKDEWKKFEANNK